MNGWWIMVCPTVQSISDRGFNVVPFKLQDEAGKGFCGMVCAMMAVVFFDHGNTCAAQLSYRQQVKPIRN